MGHYYKDCGSVYTGSDRAAKAAELMSKAAESAKTSDVYASIGYSGHSEAAARQSDVLARAAGAVLRGEPISDYEQEAYNG